MTRASLEEAYMIHHIAPAIAFATRQHLAYWDQHRRMLFPRTPGSTTAKRLETLCAELRSRQTLVGEAADPLAWAIAAGASILLRRDSETALFADGSTLRLPLHHPTGDPQ